MKKILLVTFLILATLATNAGLKPKAMPVQAKAQKASATTDGYYLYGEISPSDGVQGIGEGVAATYYVYLRLTKEDATKYAGCKIEGISFFVANLTDKTASCFIKDNYKSSETLRIKEGVEVEETAWNNVLFDEPYVVEAGKEVVIGYSVTGTADDFPVGMISNGTIANENNGIYACTINGATDYIDNLGVYDLGPNAIFALMTGDKLPQNDMSISHITTNSIITPGSQSQAVCSISNLGANDITSFDIVYSLNGGEENRTTVSGSDVKITCKKTASYILELPVLDQVGYYTLEVRVENPNGVADTDDSNNKSTHKFEVANLASHKSTLELFTFTDCYYCPSNIDNMYEAMTGRNDVFPITYHIAGPFALTSNMAYTWFYNLPSDELFAPAMMVNRTNLAPIFLSADDPGPAGYCFVTDNMVDIFDYFKAVVTKTFVDVTARYDEATRTVLVDASAHADNGIDDSNLRLNVVVTESNLVAKQMINESGVYDENHVHNDVFRANLAGQWGEPVVLSDSEPVTKNYAYTVPDNSKPENLKVVAFLSKYNSGDCNDCKVLNANGVKVIESESGVSSVAQISPVSIEALQGAIAVAGNAGEATVYGFDGAVKAHGYGDCFINVPAGFYIVKAGNTVKKVIVK